MMTMIAPNSLVRKKNEDEVGDRRKKGQTGTYNQWLEKTIEKPRLKGLFHVSDTRGKSDYTMGMFVGLENSAKYWELIRER